MMSSPLIVMVVLATAVTIGYLSINNYNLRQETADVALGAQRNVISLEESITACSAQVADHSAKLSGKEKENKKVKENNAKVEKDIKSAKAEAAENLAKVTEEYENVLIELDDVEEKANNLTERLIQLGGADYSSLGTADTSFTDAVSEASTFEGASKA